MKALQCVELGMPDKLQVNEISDPEVLPGHVLIDNKAASVNFPDVLMIQGLYQFQPELPFSPGGESAGIVSSVGEGVKNIAVGDRVFAMTGLPRGGGPAGRPAVCWRWHRASDHHAPSARRGRAGRGPAPAAAVAAPPGAAGRRPARR